MKTKAGKKKIGVLSDTHLTSPTEDLRRAMEDHFSDADLILHAGDYVDESIVDFLCTKAFFGVAGNMDPHGVTSRLPEKRVLEVEGFRIGLIHGWGSPSGIEHRIRGAFQEVDCIVYGHTHRPQVERMGGVLFFNPGSPKGAGYSRARTIGCLYVDEGIRGEIITL